LGLSNTPLIPFFQPTSYPQSNDVTANCGYSVALIRRERLIKINHSIAFDAQPDIKLNNVVFIAVLH